MPATPARAVCAPEGGRAHTESTHAGTGRTSKPAARATGAATSISRISSLDRNVRLRSPGTDRTFRRVVVARRAVLAAEVDDLQMPLAPLLGRPQFLQVALRLLHV